jgi:ABC-type antimicrobial peptide transport system permease subunit
MLKNYFKTAWRNFISNKIYSTINVLGLAAGMAVALIIGLWVYKEYSYDKFLPDYQRLYRVQRNFNSNGDILTFATTSLKLAETLRAQVPEIEYVAESDWFGLHGLAVGDKKFLLGGGITGNDFLKMFQYPMLEGNPNTALRDAYSIVITASMAKALFGNEIAMNKMVRFDNQHDLRVTGILKDIPANSTFQFNFLVPFSFLDQTSPNVKERRTGSFGINSYQQFVKLKPGVTYAQASAKIKNIEKTETDNQNAMLSDVILQPMQNWHLYSNYSNGVEEAGFLKYVRMFSIIGALVLLIAFINFINLTTARSEKRAREVGVRKAIGSGRRQLILQFLTESFMLSMMAFVCSLLIVQLCLPAFNDLTESKITIPWYSGIFWLSMLGCVVLTTLIAGSRPAFYLSSFKPVKVLKGTLKAGKTASWSRKSLVVLQFSCSVGLIISTIIVYQQIQFAKTRPTGYDLKRLLVTNMNKDLSKNYTAIRNELLQKRIVASVTVASSPATAIHWHSDVENWPGKNAGETIEMGVVIMGEDYFKTLGMTFVSGRNFKSDLDSTSVIFNEAAIKRLRIKNPLNQQITWNGNLQYTIAGVVKDALVLSPFGDADPTMFYITPNANNQNYMMYRLSPNIKTSDALAQLTEIFNKYNPAVPYQYKFSDETYAAKYKLETLTGKLAALFAGLAIFISCLGLFGLAAYTAEQRTKEIGIRKVLGASVSQVWLMLSKEFIVLVLISCIISTPVAFYFLHEWLQTYDYRTEIGAGVFIWAATIAIVITLITVSFQSVKAALMNPVKSLRTE